ncbi:hypothetical protein F0562_032549 [Nyssa sinensis]|uniref:C3H1-type domain-containing protein n=1 Tax=Nyssa sinensis TaxID=561372 RepID=A0A5J5AND8_9ASTE|nr:hypothetical protein F0562_032549 [Nyssa sinensis]
MAALSIVSRLRLTVNQTASVTHQSTPPFSLRNHICSHSLPPIAPPTKTTTSTAQSAVDYMQALELASYSTQSRINMEHQELIDRHNLCLSHLREAEKEAEALRQENVNLRMANVDLHERLQSLVNRVSLPKSISVRSKGYLKALQAGGSNGDRVRAPNRIKTVSPVNETQKVYVNGGKKEEQPVELEVFNQGMLKTELCNKWQETGACPYGDHCQFAHGIGELRPVLRHPRYKTEVCRMVLAGDRCPYGHRCHFRHTLTDEEKLMIPLRPRVVKVDQ